MWVNVCMCQCVCACVSKCVRVCEGCMCVHRQGAQRRKKASGSIGSITRM